MAGENIQELIIAVKANTDQLVKLTGDLGKVAGGFDKAGESSSKAAGEVNKFIENAANLKLVADGVLGIFESFKGAVESVADQVGKLAQNEVRLVNFSKTIGLTREEIAGLEEGVKDLGGEGEGALKGITKLGGTIQDALKDPTSDAAEKLKILGVNLASLKNSATPVADALRQIGESTKGTTLNLTQSQAASDLLGRSFKDLVGAAQNLDSNIESIKKKGQILTPEQSEAAIKLFNALDDVSDTVEGLTTQFLASLLPAFEKVNAEIGSVLETLGNDKEFTEGLTALRGVVENFISKDVPGIIRGVARITQAFVENGKALEPYLNALRNIASGGADVDLEIEARKKLDKAIAQNLEFLRNFNDKGLSENTRLSKAAALGIADAAKSIDDLRKSISKVPAAQKEAADEQVKTVKQIVDEAKKATTEVNQARQEELTNLKQRLADQLISVEQYNDALRDLAIKSADDEVKIAQDALNDILDNKQSTNEEIAKAEDELNKKLGVLADARIAKNNAESEANKKAAKEAADAALAEATAIDQLRASLDAAAAAQRAFNAAKQNAFQGEVDAITAAENLADAQTNVGLATAAVNDILNNFRKQLEFTFDPTNIIAAEAKVKELEETYKGFIKTLNEVGPAALVQEAAVETAEKIAEIQTQIRQAQIDAVIKQINEEKAARIEAARSAAIELFKIDQDLAAKRKELNQEERQDEEKAVVDTRNQQAEAAQDRIDAKTKEDAAIADETERFRQHEAAEDQKDKDAALKREQDFADDAAKIRDRTRDDNLKGETDAFVEITSLQNQLRDLEDQLKKGGLSTEDEARLLSQKAAIDQQLAAAQAKETARKKAAAEEQAKIDKAIAEGGSSQVLDAKVEEIKAETSLEKERNEAIAKLGKNATQAQLDELNRLFDERLKNLRSDLAAQLALFDAQEKARIAQRAAERAADQQAHTDRLNDATAAYAKDIEAINTRNNAALTAIADRLSKELKAIQDQRAAVEAEAVAQAAAIVTQFGIASNAVDAFIKSLGAGYKDLLGLIDQIIAKQGQIATTAQAQTNAGNAGANNAPTPGLTGSPGTSGATNPFGITAKDTASRGTASASFNGAFGDQASQDFFGQGAGVGSISISMPVGVTVNTADAAIRALREQLPAGIQEIERQLKKAERQQRSLVDRGGFRPRLGFRN